MFKGLESALFIFLGTAAGLLSTNFNHFFKLTTKYGTDPIFLVVGLILLVVGKVFPQLSAKIIANIWAGAYSSYIALPATKIMTGMPMAKQDKYLFYASLISGLVISWFLFRRAERRG